MIALLYVPVSLVLIVLQTTIVPDHSFLSGCHDLLLLLVVHASLTRPLKESLPSALIMGLIMDGLSAAPLGLHATAYSWISVVVSWLMMLFHVRSRWLSPFVYAAAALTESAIFLAGMVLLVPDVVVPEAVLFDILMPMLWMMVIGPLFGLALDGMHQKLSRWHSEYMLRRSGYQRI